MAARRAGKGKAAANLSSGCAGGSAEPWEFTGVLLCAWIGGCWDWIQAVGAPRIRKSQEGFAYVKLCHYPSACLSLPPSVSLAASSCNRIGVWGGEQGELVLSTATQCKWDGN